MFQCQIDNSPLKKIRINTKGEHRQRSEEKGGIKRWGLFSDCFYSHSRTSFPPHLNLLDSLERSCFSRGGWERKPAAAWASEEFLCLVSYVDLCVCVCVRVSFSCSFALYFSALLMWCAGFSILASFSLHFFSGSSSNKRALLARIFGVKLPSHQSSACPCLANSGIRKRNRWRSGLWFPKICLRIFPEIWIFFASMESLAACHSIWESSLARDARSSKGEVKSCVLFAKQSPENVADFRFSPFLNVRWGRKGGELWVLLCPSVSLLLSPPRELFESAITSF